MMVFKKNLRKQGCLHTLDLSGTDAFLEGVEGCGRLAAGLLKLPQLRVLRMSASDIKGNVCPALADMMLHLPKLEILDVRNNNIDLDGCQVLAGAIGKMKHLRHLDMNENNIHPASLAAALRSFSTLERLDLHRTIRFINGEGSVQLAASLAHHTSLQGLNFSRNFCGILHDKQVAMALAKSLCNMPWMTYLNVRHNSFGDEAGSVLAHAISNMPYLQTLKVSNSGIADAGCTALSETLKGRALPCLKTLDLSSNSFGSASCSQLVSLLEATPALSILCLDNNRLGSWLPLTAFSKLPMLQDLKLDRCELNNLEARGLGQALVSASSLQRLSLHNNNIDRKAGRDLRAALQASLPALSIHGLD